MIIPADDVLSIQNAYRVVEMMTDDDLAFGEGYPELGRLYLQVERAPLDSIVVVDDALFFHAEDVIEIFAKIGSECRAG